MTTEQLKARAQRVNFDRGFKAEKALFEAGYLRDVRTQNEKLPDAILDLLVDLLHLADNFGVKLQPEDLLIQARQIYDRERPQ